MTSSTSNISIFSDLFRRRVPQILAIYGAGCWTIVQIVEWVIDRYLISPHLTDLCLIAMLSFIPSIALIAYYHGTPGRDKWHPIEKIGIPLNIFASMLILFIAFFPKDLGAVTETVTIENETGEIINKIIPKAIFRKKIATFNFENETGDTTNNWLKYGLPYLINEDLKQDIYLSHIDQANFSHQVEDYGYMFYESLPLNVKKKIANRLNKTFFLLGKYELIDNSYVISITLYKTKNLQKVFENTYIGEDIFSLVDKLTYELKNNIDIPRSYLLKNVDLPVESITTNNQQSLKFYIQAINELNNFNSLKAIDLLDKSIVADKLFLSAQVLIAEQKRLLLSDDGWKDHYDIVLKYIDKVSENNLYNFKMSYYNLKGDAELYKKLALIRVELYPDDIDALAKLAEVYSKENIKERLDNTINQYKKILKIDPYRYEYYRKIGKFYYIKNKYDSSLYYYNKYKDLAAEDYTIYDDLAFINKMQGKYSQSKNMIDIGLIHNPDNIKLNIDILENQYYQKVLDGEEVIPKLFLLLNNVDNFKDSLIVYHDLLNFYYDLGQLSSAINISNLIYEIEFSKYGEHAIVHKLLNSWQLYLDAGLNKELIQLIEDYSNSTQNNNKAYQLCLYYLGTQNFKMLKETVNEAERQLAET